MKFFLAACLLGAAVAVPLPEEPRDGILPVVAQIKGIVSTDYGYQQVKAYLLQLKSEDAVAQRIRDTIHRHSDEELKEAFNAFFAKIPILAIEPGFDYPTLDNLFGQVKKFLSIDAGVAVARTYMENLDTPNEIVGGILSRLLVLDAEELKNFFGVMFSHVPDVTYSFFSVFYDVKAELDHIAEQLKAILSTSNGIQQVRDHLKALQTTNPTIILVKTVLSAMSDASLIDLVKEIGKNIKDVPIDSDNPDLVAIVLKGKDLIITDEGIKFVRDYLENLQTANFLVVRVKTLVKSFSDQQLKEAIEEGAKEVFGQGYSAFYKDVDAELHALAEQIKAFLIRPEGLQQVRDHLKALQSTNPTIILIKTVLSAMSDDSLIDLVKEVGKDIKDVSIDVETTDLLALVLQAKDLAITDEGLKVVKDYLDNLKTANFLIARVKTFVASLSDAKLKEVIVTGAAELFGQGYSAFYEDVDAELHRIGEQIKAFLIQPEGLQQVRDHLKALQSTNPTIILIKTVLSAMSDSSLIDLVKEVGKDIKDVSIDVGSLDLLTLVLRAKDLALTDAGLKIVRDYLDNLQTANFLVARVKTFVKTLSDEQLKEVIVKGAAELFGQGYVLQSASYADDLHSLFVWIKHNLKSQKYFQDLKNYLTNLKATNVYVKMGKEFFLQMSEEQMKEVLNEFLKKFPDIEIEPGFDYPDLLSLFVKVKTSILTSNGLQQLREYAAELESDNFIVQRLQAALLTVDDKTLTDILVDLFQGV